MSRRRVSVVAAAACLAACQVAPPQSDAGPTSLSATRAQLAAGSLTSEALVARALHDIERTRANNAFISVDASGALQAARRRDADRDAGVELGPLHGIPIVVKDNIHVAQLPNTAGTPLLRDFVPQADATVVSRLRSAGAIILGKTNLHELAFGITSMNAAFGAVANARNPDYFAGGSSGGTASAIGSGVVVAGLGTDTGGSSRIPAALNGIVGFRPTVGRYPADGLTRISSTRDTVGPMGRGVADVALLDAVLSGDDATLERIELSGLRLGVPRAYFYDDLEPDVARSTERLLAALRAEGATLVMADVDGIGELNEQVGFPVVLYEAGELLREYLAANRPGTTLEDLQAAIASPDVKGVMASIAAGAIAKPAYLEALHTHRPRLQAAYDTYFSLHAVDAMIFPTTPLTARPIRGSADTVELNGRRVPVFPTFIRNTDPGSNAGIPGLSLPLATASNGLPIGIEIDGRAGDDRRLLAIGVALETFIDERLGETRPTEPTGDR